MAEASSIGKMSMAGGVRLLGFGFALACSSTVGAAEVKNGELPSVSPNGKLIAYATDRSGQTELRVIGANGAGDRSLANVPDAGPLAWTRDGRSVLVSSAAGDVGRLEALPVNGSDRRTIATAPGRRPTLSPDGKLIAFMTGPYTTDMLMVCRVDGSKSWPVSDGKGPAWNPQWSPDGSQIAFTSREGPSEELRIYIVNRDGSGRRLVTRLPGGSGNAQWPEWSPDGRRLAMQVSGPTPGYAAIWVLDLRSSKMRVVTTHSAIYLDETPSWFPDGRRLAFQSNRTGEMEVWVTDVDGSHQRQLTKARKGGSR